jgi:hypothetical protein
MNLLKFFDGKEWIALYREIISNCLVKSKNLSDLENLTEAFEKASSGMDLTEAQTLASKLGTTLADSDFVFKQGQYYYNNIEAIKEAYLKNNEETKKALEENTKEQIDILTKVDVDFTPEEQETYSTLQNTYKEVFENLTEEERQGAKTWQQYAIAQIKESQIDFYEAEEPDRPSAQFVLCTKGRLAAMEDLWNKLNEII